MACTTCQRQQPKSAKCFIQPFNILIDAPPYTPHIHGFEAMYNAYTRCVCVCVCTPGFGMSNGAERPGFDTGPQF